MLDSEVREAPASPVSLKAVEYLTIQLSMLADGAVFVSLLAISVDDQAPQLLSQEILTERVATIEEALALIGSRVRGTNDVDETSTDNSGDTPTTLFCNFYRCERCGHEWTDVWSATCDDDCPRCGARHMSPVRSEEVEDGDE